MKTLLKITLLLVCVLLVAQPVLADGIIIIDPPLPPDSPPWLTIRYHRVTIAIQDQIATTTVDQVFCNNSPFTTEGTYIFPLPPDAVVQDFTMWIDGEPIAGELLPADEARAIYEEYVRRNQDPALLEYVGRDAVRVRIFPIPPGAERRIQLTYTEILPVDGGLLHYRYPLNTERFSAQPLEQVSISVEVASQTPLRALYSPTHQDEVLISRRGANAATVSYEASNLLPNRDFELYVGLSADEIGASLLTYQPLNEDGFFLLILSPSLEVAASRILPQDLFLVLDTSGSMEGDKLSQAQAALRYILDHLNAEDRFNVIAFSSEVRPYAPRLQAAASAPAAAAWVAGLEALGGTNIYLALSETLAQADPERATLIIFLTDGLPTEGLTDEQALLGTLNQEAPPNVRIFPFGVGYDVNTLLLDQLAEDHRGRPAYVTPDEQLDEQVSAFYARVQSPLLTNISLDFGATGAYDLYPHPLPDLYAGTQLIVAGRYTGAAPRSVRLSGELEGRAQTYTYADLTPNGQADFIPRLWAARKIGYLLTQIRLHGENPELVDSIVTLSLRYGIITPYTAFLVEEDQLTSERREQATDEFLALPAPPAYGQEAVKEAESRNDLGHADAPPPAAQLPTGNLGGAETSATEIRYVGEHTFLCTTAACTDTRFVPDQMQPVEIGFDTASYWALLTARPDWGAYLALAREVTFMAADGSVYHIVPDGPDTPLDLPTAPPATPLPPHPTAGPTPGAPVSTPTPTPIAPAAPGANAGPCPGPLFLGLLFLAVLPALRKH